MSVDSSKSEENVMEQLNTNMQSGQESLAYALAALSEFRLAAGEEEGEGQSGADESHCAVCFSCFGCGIYCAGNCGNCNS
jgi:hypothetical protein